MVNYSTPVMKMVGTGIPRSINLKTFTTTKSSSDSKIDSLIKLHWLQTLCANDVLANTPELKIQLKQNPGPSHLMVLDLETNIYGDILQIAYQIYNDKLNLIKEVNSFVANRIVDHITYDVHKISKAVLSQKGIQFNDVISCFVRDLNDVLYLIGHNIGGSDIKKLRLNISRYNVQITTLDTNSNIKKINDIFESKIIECTMDKSKKMCDLKNKRGHLKKPTLGEVYEFLFGAEMINAHDALVDVKHTAKCYFEIKRLEQFENIFNESNKLDILMKNTDNDFNEINKEFKKLNS
jgi:hypothetical protein